MKRHLQNYQYINLKLTRAWKDLPSKHQAIAQQIEESVLQTIGLDQTLAPLRKIQYPADQMMKSPILCIEFDYTRMAGFLLVITILIRMDGPQPIVSFRASLRNQDRTPIYSANAERMSISYHLLKLNSLLRLGYFSQDEAGSLSFQIDWIHPGHRAFETNDDTTIAVQIMSRTLVSTMRVNIFKLFALQRIISPEKFEYINALCPPNSIRQLAKTAKKYFTKTTQLLTSFVLETLTENDDDDHDDHDKKMVLPPKLTPLPETKYTCLRCLKIKTFEAVGLLTGDKRHATFMVLLHADVHDLSALPSVLQHSPTTTPTTPTTTQKTMETIKEYCLMKCPPVPAEYTNDPLRYAKKLFEGTLKIKDSALLNEAKVVSLFRDKYAGILGYYIHTNFDAESPFLFYRYYSSHTLANLCHSISMLDRTRLSLLLSVVQTLIYLQTKRIIHARFVESAFKITQVMGVKLGNFTEACSFEDVQNLSAVQPPAELSTAPERFIAFQMNQAQTQALNQAQNQAQTQAQTQAQNQARAQDHGPEQTLPRLKLEPTLIYSDYFSLGAVLLEVFGETRFFNSRNDDTESIAQSYLSKDIGLNNYALKNEYMSGYVSQTIGFLVGFLTNPEPSKRGNLHRLAEILSELGDACETLF